MTRYHQKDETLGDSRAREVYRTQQEAFDRVGQLQRAGLWPGVRTCDDGYRLTFDRALRSEP